ncbi:hypothetical protein ACFJYX_11505 [Enterococcus faecalis]|nr:hypothetical protein [Enterococcus faecalis]
MNNLKKLRRKVIQKRLNVYKKRENMLYKKIIQRRNENDAITEKFIEETRRINSQVLSLKKKLLDISEKLEE